MTKINDTAYPAEIAILRARDCLPELGPGSPNEPIKLQLRALEAGGFGTTVRDAEMALACISGLWLWHDFLEESHRISQDLHSATGSYWHAIMHRREPDADNSKYWFRQMGHHPVVEQLFSEAPSLDYDYRTPAEFVDFCERVRNSGSKEEEIAKRIQQLEWQLLFDWCWVKATQ